MESPPSVVLGPLNTYLSETFCNLNTGLCVLVRGIALFARGGEYVLPLSFRTSTMDLPYRSEVGQCYTGVARKIDELA